MSVRFSGYTSSGVSLDEMSLRGHWVVLREVWDQFAPEGIVLPRRGNTTIGEVLSVGDRVDEDINVGDKILFEEWQGGRWSFQDGEGHDVPCLLIDEMYIKARLTA